MTIEIISEGHPLKAETLGWNSKNGRLIRELYRTSQHADLWGVYDRPSAAKAKAWQKVRDEMRDVGGHDLWILAFNTYHFSCAYRVTDDEGITWIICHTSHHTYAIQEA